MSQRIGHDGLPAEDVKVNPKYLLRIEAEEKERKRLETEAAGPWSRARVERELSRIAALEPVEKVNGHDVKACINLHGADLSGLDLSGLDLSRANLHGANLHGANLSGCRLVNANLHGANMDGAVLEGVNAFEANFSSSCLCNARMSKGQFMRANLSEACYESSDGLDVQEKSLTPAEEMKARLSHGESVRVKISTDDGTVTYVGDTLRGANVTGMSRAHKERR